MLLEAGRSFSPAVMSQTEDDEVDSAFRHDVSFFSVCLLFFCLQDNVIILSDKIKQAELTCSDGVYTLVDFAHRMSVIATCVSIIKKARNPCYISKNQQRR